MQLNDCNPYIRAAEVQSSVLEQTGLRKAYDYRLFYVLENEGSIFIENQNYPIRPHTLIILPPAIAYDFQGQLKVIVVNFDITRKFSHKVRPLFPPVVAKFDGHLLFDTQLLEGFDRPLVLHTDMDTQERVLQIVFNFNTQGQYADAITSALLKLLFSYLLERNEDPQRKLIERIMGYIRVHAATLYCNEDVAQAFGYHPVYLNELIKRTTGKTLHHIIMDAKLQIACRWLDGTNETIETISDMAGFCSRTHFSTLFKKRLGQTPAEYRKRH